MEHTSLHALFEQNKQKLQEALMGLTIPKDAQRVQNVISEHLSSLLLEDGDFRQHLTQSEDYILQAVLAILNAQQARFACLPTINLEDSQQEPECGDNSKEKEIHVNKKISKLPLNVSTKSVAAGVGAWAGGALLGTWGAVCGAIAGTALTTYLVQDSKDDKERISDSKPIKISSDEEKPLDIDSIVIVCANLCKSVDDIIVTFRAQINNVVQKYEGQEKPSLEKEYSTLIDGIQSLVGYNRAHSNDEKFSKKIQERIEDLAESLENYNLSFVDYDGTNIVLFDIVPSSNAVEDKQVLPAIVKENAVVRKGKLFKPEK